MPEANVITPYRHISERALELSYGQDRATATAGHGRNRNGASRRKPRERGQDVSKWILGLLLPEVADEFQRLTDRLKSDPATYSVALAAVHDFLQSLSAKKLEVAVKGVELDGVEAWAANYLAAMVEYACVGKQVPVPDWARAVEPLSTPWFATRLESLRLHLLTTSPAPFRRRNLFVDSTLGARV